MKTDLKKTGLKMIEKANASDNQIFGSFYLSRLLGLKITFEKEKISNSRRAIGRSKTTSRFR